MRILLTVTCLLSLTLNSQNLNLENLNSRGKKILLGEIDKSGLKQEPFRPWFSKNYESYEPNEAITESLLGKLKDYSITIFMGTWCGDSKREVPRFYKIIEALEFPKNQLKVVALSNDYASYKQSPQHEEKGLNIHRVPTFIFYKNGREVNRIVEHPVISLEEDILSIVNDNNYEPNFQIVKAVNRILEDSGAKALKRKQKMLIEEFSEKTKTYSELNTYGTVLSTTNRIEEAIALHKLNLKLFPETSRVYRSLANAYTLNDNTKKAKNLLKRAIRKFPKNVELSKYLRELQAK